MESYLHLSTPGSMGFVLLWETPIPETQFSRKLIYEPSGVGTCMERSRLFRDGTVRLHDSLFCRVQLLREADCSRKAFHMV